MIRKTCGVMLALCFTSSAAMDVVMDVLDQNGVSVEGLVYSSSSQTYVPAPYAFSMNNGGTINAIASAFWRNAVQFGSLQVWQDTTYTIDVTGQTPTLTKNRTPGVTRVDFVFKILNVPVAIVDQNGQAVDGTVYLGVPPHLPAPAFLTIANGGRISITANSNRRQMVAGYIDIWEGSRHVVDATGAGLARRDEATPGETSVQFQVKILNVAAAIVDQNDQAVDGTVYLGAQPYVPAPASFTIANGGQISVAAITNRRQILPGYIYIWEGNRHVVDATGAGLARRDEATPGETSVQFQVKILNVAATIVDQNGQQIEGMLLLGTVPWVNAPATFTIANGGTILLYARTMGRQDNVGNVVVWEGNRHVVDAKGAGLARRDEATPGETSIQYQAKILDVAATIVDQSGQQIEGLLLLGTVPWVNAPAAFTIANGGTILLYARTMGRQDNAGNVIVWEGYRHVTDATGPGVTNSMEPTPGETTVQFRYDIIDLPVDTRNQLGQHLSGTVNLGVGSVPSPMVHRLAAGASVIGSARADDKTLVWNGPGPAIYRNRTYTVDGSTSPPTMIEEPTPDVTAFNFRFIVPIPKADLQVTTSAPATTHIGEGLTQTITLSNLGPDDAEHVTLVDQLPPGVDFSTQDGSHAFTRNAQNLSWSIPSLPSGASEVIQVGVVVNGSAALGTMLFQAGAGSDTRDENLDNNAAIYRVTVEPAYRFDAVLSPSQRTASLGTPVLYEAVITNTGNFEDTYALNFGGLDPSWYTLSDETVNLRVGEVATVRIGVQTDDCAATQAHSFQIGIASAGGAAPKTLDGSVTFVADPIVTELSPANNATIGSTTAMFVWRTDVQSSSRLFIRPQGTQSYTEHTAAPAILHTVGVAGLSRNTRYEWYVQSESLCGSTSSAVRVLEVGNGVVFTQRAYNFVVERDYNQIRTVTVRNDDVVPHTVVVRAEHTGDVLRVGFVGGGSEDLTITLAPGDERNIDFAIHAQDAEPNAHYAMLAHLTADDGSALPIEDFAMIDVFVEVASVDFTLDQIGYDPTTQVREFRITNGGETSIPLTDLWVGWQRLTGEGQLYLTPSVDHAYLRRGESLTFKAVPVMSPGFDGMTVRVVATAAETQRSVTYDVTCPAGSQVYKGRAGFVTVKAESRSHYCTNHPRSRVFLVLPAGFERSLAVKAEVTFNITNYLRVAPHGAEFFFNGEKIGEFYGTPSGIRTFDIPLGLLAEAAGEVSKNEFLVKSYHRGGHYIAFYNATLQVAMCDADYGEYVCATGQTEADAIVQHRSYVIPPAGSISVVALEPEAEALVQSGKPVVVRAQVIVDDIADRERVVLAQASDGSGVQLRDNGLGGDVVAGDGIYSGEWWPLGTGRTDLNITTEMCEDITSSVVPVNLFTAPNAIEDFAEASEDVPLSLDVLANDTDADGDPLSVQSVTQPAHGTLVNHGTYLAYTPAPNYSGNDAFSYVATDPMGNTAQASVRIFVRAVNDGSPVANPDDATVMEDGSVTIDVLANDTDIDGDPLSITAVTQPLNGNVVRNGAKVVYTPEPNFNGTDAFTYQVSDGHGGIGTGDVTVVITSVNDAPTAVNDVAVTDEDEAVVIPVLANDSDPEGNAMTVVAVTEPSNGTVVNNGTEVLYTPNQDFNGTDAFTYTVSDGEDGEATANVSVTVNSVNDAPTAVKDVAVTDEDQAVVIAVLANDSDPEGDAMSVVAVTQPANGAVANNGTEVLYTPDPDYNGTDAFTYSVGDDNGDVATASVTVTINSINDAPTGVGDVTVTDEDVPVAIPVLANDSDRDGDALTVVAATQPGHGAVVNNGTDVLYTPEPDYNGTDAFTYSVGDGNGSVATVDVSVTINSVNDVPVGAADVAVTDEDVPVTIPVLANDSDVDGDALTVAAVTQPANGTAAIVGAAAGLAKNVATMEAVTTLVYTPNQDFNGTDAFTYDVSDGNGGVVTVDVSVTINSVNDAPVGVDDVATTDEDRAVTITILANDRDVDGDVLAITAVNQPGNGVVAVGANDVTYTPAPDFYGSESFTYAISDGNGGVSTAWVVVTVNSVNDLPVAVDDAAVTDEDVAITIDVLHNDSDVDGDVLAVLSVTEPANGWVTNNGTDVVYTPTAGFTGSDGFTYVVDDGYGGTATASVEVTVIEVNQAPVAEAGDNISAHAGDIALLSGHGSMDPDGDYPLGYTWTLVDRPVGSQAQIIDPNLVSASLEVDVLAQYTVQLVVTDARGKQSIPDSVVVSALNSVPVADAGPDQQITSIGSQVLLDATGTLDPDGDAVQYQWVLVERPEWSSATLEGSQTANPSFLPDVYGDYVVQLTVSDAWGTGEPDSVLVTFSNVAPVSDAGDNVSIVLGEIVQLDGTGSSDANGDFLSYQWDVVAAPNGSTAELTSPTSAQPTFAPDLVGEYVLGLVVNDGLVNSDVSHVTIAVVTAEEAVSQAIGTAISSMNDLPDESFVTANTRLSLARQLGTVRMMIDRGQYLPANRVLTRTIIARFDGCATIGQPDHNDWITDCDAQAEVYQQLLEATGLLEELEQP